MTPTTTEYREIPLTQGKVALVDLSDYDWLNQWKWHAYLSPKVQRFYAARNGPKVDGKKRSIYMHRVIMGLEYGDKRKADHVEPLNTLDNRRSNLRICTNAENVVNCGPHKDNKCGFKGVYWGGRQGERWVVKVRAGGKQVFRKSINNLRDAAQVYALISYLHHGEFSRISL